MITLWGRNNSTNVKKVRWVLEELDLPYEQILAGLEFGLNHDPEYLAMNPNGLVPLLKDDATGVVLWESNTIIRYLAAQYGVDRLRLAAPAQRAQGEKWMDWSNGTLSPAHRPVLMGLVRTPPEQRDPAAIAAGISACMNVGLVDRLKSISTASVAYMQPALVGTMTPTKLPGSPPSSFEARMSERSSTSL